MVVEDPYALDLRKQALENRSGGGRDQRTRALRRGEQPCAARERQGDEQAADCDHLPSLRFPFSSGFGIGLRGMHLIPHRRVVDETREHDGGLLQVVGRHLLDDVEVGVVRPCFVIERILKELEAGSPSASNAMWSVPPVFSVVSVFAPR